MASSDDVVTDEWRKVLDELKEHRHSAALSSHQAESAAPAAVVSLSPMDLNAVRSAVDSGAFKTTAEFLRSVALMFLNVTMSNSSNTEVTVRMLGEFRKRIGSEQKTEV